MNTLQESSDSYIRKNSENKSDPLMSQIMTGEKINGLSMLSEHQKNRVAFQM